VIREWLAAADPGNAGWQRDLVVSNRKLATFSGKTDPVYLGRCHDTLQGIRAKGVFLDPPLVQFLTQLDDTFSGSASPTSGWEVP
jgi:hypothetical protein